MFRPLLLEHSSTTVRLGLAWSRVQPFPRKKLRILARPSVSAVSDEVGGSCLKVFSPFRLGLFGALCFLAGLIWVAFWVRVTSEARQWNVDAVVVAPTIPRFMVILGFWLLVVCLAWSAIARFRRRRTPDKPGL
jgi:hypothetical protein